MKRGLGFLFGVLFFCVAAQATEFDASLFTSEGLAGAKVNAAGLSFSNTKCQRFMAMRLSNGAGSYAVRILVNVPENKAGSVLQVGEWITQDGRFADYKLVPLNSTGGTDQWISLGDIYFQHYTDEKPALLCV